MLPAVKDVSTLHISGKITDFHFLADELHRCVIHTAVEMNRCIPVYPPDDPVEETFLQPLPVPGVALVARYPSNGICPPSAS